MLVDVYPVPTARILDQDGRHMVLDTRRLLGFSITWRKVYHFREEGQMR